MSLYNYLYYLIYKFLDLNASEETRVHVPSISRALFLIGFTNYYLAFILTIKLFNYITYSSLVFAIIFIVPLVTMYFFNEKYLFKEENYKEIESRFDKKNKFKKIHFTLLAVLYLFGSIATMIWAGINYANNS
jgi:hypothetical protein